MVAIDQAELVTDDGEDAEDKEGDAEGWQGIEEEEPSRVVVAGDLFEGKVGSGRDASAEKASG